MRRARTIPFALYAVFMLASLNYASGQDFMPERYKTLNYDAYARSFCFAPDGKHSALTTGDNGIILYDEAFNAVWSHKGNPENYGGSAVFTPDGQYMIFSRYQSNTDIALFNIKETKVVQYLKSQKYVITDVAISPDGKVIATGGDAREVKLYTLLNGRLRTLGAVSVDCPDFQFINSVSFSPDGKFMAAAGTGTDIFFFTVDDTIVKPLQTEPFKFWTDAVTFSKDSRYMISATADSLYVWNYDHGKFRKIGVYECFGGATEGLNFTTDGNFLCATKENAMIYIFAWKQGKPETYNELETHTRCVFDVEFSSDGLFMATSSLDQTVILWKLADVSAWEQRVLTTQDKGIRITQDSVNVAADPNAKNILFVIGINEYTDWPALHNATGDAKAVKSVLEERYGFVPENTYELYDQQATKKNMLDKLSLIQKSAGESDNLIIYYSGHGFYNQQIDEGYWIPFDAKKNEETDYLPNSTLVKYIRSINCKHIFLVVDACFSGSLFSDGHKGYVDKVSQFRSRWCLSSGRLELVSDGKTGDNSPFASYFLKFLRENTKPQFPVSELIQYVKVAVSNNTEQTPIGNPLKNVGDEGGEFIFILK